MARNTVFLIDALGEGWQHEITDDMRIEPRADVVRGLTARRYMQMMRFFPSDPHTDILAALAAGMSLADAAGAVGMSQRQIKNSIHDFLARLPGAVAQQTFLPPPRPVATSLHIERRPRSRRGRPPKDRKALPPPQAQAVLPF